MLDFTTFTPAQASDGMPLLVLLHGRGADADDMAAIARLFGEAIVVTPRAPFPAQPWGYGPGYAWYRYLGGVTPHPQDFSASLIALDELLQHLPAALPILPGPLFLGGFSQGGTMSLGYALSRPGTVHTVLNLSGFLASHPDVRVTPEAIDGLRIYWPHGRSDAAIPYSTAEQGRAQLRAAGAQLITRDFAAGHTIIPEEIDDIRTLLQTP